MANKPYQVTNLFSGEDVDDNMEYRYECDECTAVFDWHKETLMQALIHSQKRGHTKGRLSYRKVEEEDTND